MRKTKAELKARIRYACKKCRMILRAKDVICGSGGTQCPNCRGPVSPTKYTAFTMDWNRAQTPRKYLRGAARSRRKGLFSGRSRR